MVDACSACITALLPLDLLLPGDQCCGWPQSMLGLMVLSLYWWRSYECR